MECINRVCKTCKAVKPLQMFPKHESGYRHKCKTCTNAKSIEYFQNNRETYLSKNRERHHIRLKTDETYRHKLNENARKFRLNNLEACKKRLQVWRNNNKDKIIEYGKRKAECLDDNYIRSNMVRDGFTKELLSEYPELIQLKKEIIKNIRLCKTSKN